MKLEDLLAQAVALVPQKEWARLRSWAKKRRPPVCRTGERQRPSNTPSL